MSKIKIFSLGGLNEKGKNMYIVDVDNDIFVLDAGLKYADDKMLGIDYIIPNFDYLKENKERVKGIFITHGHDGQMGAVSEIIEAIPEINIYGTKFTIEILKEELKDANIESNNLHIIEPHRNLNFGNVSIFPISVTHSVPGSVCYVIDTEDGAIVYTGNFVFDQTMQGEYKTDIGKLAYVGKKGVLCLMSESIYAEKKGYTAPNNRITQVITKTLDQNEGRIIFNISQTQFYRIQELFEEIMKTDRKVVILGKRLENMIYNAIDMKYIDFDKRKIGTIKNINDSNIVVIVSDERERPFSNISRIIKGYDKFLNITENDTVVFASPVYEGMEKRATRVYDDVAKIGSNLIILSSSYLSNHASSEDLMMMINLMNPKYYFPVIGEYKQQVENANNAKKVGYTDENIILKLNGMITEFRNGKLVETDEFVKIDEILIDGKTVGDISELVIKDRELLSDNGIVLVSATLDKKTKKILAGPEILTRGFIYVKENIDIIKEAEKISLEVINENIKNNYVEFNKIKLGIREKLGKYLYKETECKPMILIVMQEV
ncbi:MAG: ribonuclease J [Lactobacillales bacterium]|nr:ribonuclease J [Lactobacillales bacterium]